MKQNSYLASSVPVVSNRYSNARSAAAAAAAAAITGAAIEHSGIDQGAGMPIFVLLAPALRCRYEPECPLAA